ncbi:hypothetical protein NGM99_12585 [Mesorhizobium sp. RP14(2022)]|uniref:Uncharacterized protein n=1 Tax=Mesorhizobium liriopis TaxID=2953882 RepID=A0ABT1C726_9HYPH|nr:hypothetical protein [Mesorhizobium liriopis]MCO6050620.1 hypothetical protein [Mesorhizobium liriopis]
MRFYTLKRSADGKLFGVTAGSRDTAIEYLADLADEDLTLDVFDTIPPFLLSDQDDRAGRTRFVIPVFRRVL